MNVNNIDNKKQFWIFFIILAALTLLMIYCFMPSHRLNSGDDMLFHFRRFESLMIAIKNGSFPIYLDFDAFEGYGYGTKWFYSDLILLPFAYLANLIGFVLSYKIMWFVMTILCGIFTYKMINRIYNNTTAAKLGALLYTFSSYRLQDIFQRGALGEALSFTFIPIVFYGLYEIIKGDYRKWYIIALSFSLLIYTHLLSSVLAFITVIIYVLIYYKDFITNTKRLYSLLLAGIVTVFLCSYLILPLVEQIQNISFHVNDMGLRDNTQLSLPVFLSSILYPHLIFANSSFVPYIGVLLIACLVLRFFIKEKSESIKSIDIGVLIGVIYLLLSLSIIPWDKYPLKLFRIIQFPWRLFEFSTFFFAIAAGYYLSKILVKKKYSKIVCALIIILIACLIFTNGYRYKIIKGYYNFPKDAPEMTIDKYHIYFQSLEYFPKNLTVDIIKENGQNINVSNRTTTISDISRKDGSVNFNITTLGQEVIEFPLTYYKGYTAHLNNPHIKIPRELEVRESARGLVEVSIPNQSSGNVVVKFNGTFVQKYSIYITLISFILLLMYIYSYNRKRKKNINA